MAACLDYEFLTMGTAMDTRTFKTSDLMKMAQVGRNTLRLYERRGLIQRAHRTASGYRQYSQQTLADLEFIKQAKGSGLSLEEISELLSLTRNDGSTCGVVSQRIEAKIGELDVLLVRLQQRRAFLHEFLGVCAAKSADSRCDIARKGIQKSACCG